MKFNGIKSLSLCKMVMFTKTQAIYIFFFKCWREVMVMIHQHDGEPRYPHRNIKHLFASCHGRGGTTGLIHIQGKTNLNWDSEAEPSHAVRAHREEKSSGLVFVACRTGAEQGWACLLSKHAWRRVDINQDRRSQEVCLEKTPQEYIFPTVFLFADTPAPIQDPPEKVLKDRARIHIGELTRWGTHTGRKPPKGLLNQFLFFSSLP